MTKVSTVVRALRSLPTLGVVLFVFSVAFPPFDDATTLSPAVHMLEHVLIVLSGVLIGYPLYRRGYIPRIGRRAAGLALLGVCMLLVAWHVPLLWDEAVLNPGVHALEHLSLLAAGILIGSVVLILPDGVKVGALLLGLVVHTLYSLVLLSSLQVYPPYSLSQQADLGFVVAAMDPIFIVLVFYVLWNPGPAEKVSSGYVPIRLSPANSRRLRRIGMMTPVLTIVIAATLVGFYSWSAAEVSASPAHGSRGDSTVYILETPVTWGYSPENITVVVGVNSTVTWISHSLGYDTITSTDGNFSSGVIAPGQTFSYFFQQTGVYEYHCLYHPWMIGYVTVVS